MAWLDDRVWCHPKFTDLSAAAFAAYCRGLAYSSGMNTRGVLTVAQQKLIGAAAKTRGELVAAGLWDEHPDGVRVHDWDEHNGKRDERREQNRKRVQAHRDRKREQYALRNAYGKQYVHALTEVTEVKEVTTTSSSPNTFGDSGWNQAQAKQAEADPERAIAWLESARNPSVRNAPAFAWAGFKAGGWPKASTPDYEWIPPACEECGNLIRDGHTNECSVGAATRLALAEFEEVGT